MVRMLSSNRGTRTGVESGDRRPAGGRAHDDRRPTDPRDKVSERAVGKWSESVTYLGLNPRTFIDSPKPADRLARQALPFSTVPSDGRPMTPDVV
jgi:hypothetical protein